MTPWVWPAMKLNPPNWIEPITQACEAGGSSCFTTGIDPGFANDLFPMTLMGLCGEVRKVRALEILDYTNYEGDYEFEMGIGKPPEHRPLLENPDILILAWGATVPMIAHAAGIELDEITTTWDKWVTADGGQDGEGGRSTRQGRRHPLHHQRRLRGETRIQLEHVNRVGDGRRPGLADGQRERRLPRRDRGHVRPSFRRRRSASPTALGGMLRPRAAWRPGCARSTPYPPSTTLPPGWVTALDLPLIAGEGTIR